MSHERPQPSNRPRVKKLYEGVAKVPDAEPGQAYFSIPLPPEAVPVYDTATEELLFYETTTGTTVASDGSIALIKERWLSPDLQRQMGGAIHQTQLTIELPNRSIKHTVVTDMPRMEKHYIDCTSERFDDVILAEDIAFAAIEIAARDEL